MEYGFKISPLYSFKDEVAMVLRGPIRSRGSKTVSEELCISRKYAGNIVHEFSAPLHNLDLCADILKNQKDANYYAIIVPEKIVGKDVDYDLDVFKGWRYYWDSSYGRGLGSKCPSYPLTSNLYKDVLSYWRANIYDGMTGKGLSRISELTDQTLNSAIRGDISPRCSTVQKILTVYGLRLIVLKTKELEPGDTIKILH